MKSQETRLNQVDSLLEEMCPNHDAEITVCLGIGSGDRSGQDQAYADRADQQLGQA